MDLFVTIVSHKIANSRFKQLSIKKKKYTIVYNAHAKHLIVLILQRAIIFALSLEIWIKIKEKCVCIYWLCDDTTRNRHF